MSKNAMFSLSPFDYSPSNFLTMSPGGEGLQVISHDDDNDDEPEVIFSNIPEKKSMPIPAEEFQVEILQRIGKLEELIEKFVHKN
jgi:hypothetical protein